MFVEAVALFLGAGVTVVETPLVSATTFALNVLFLLDLNAFKRPWEQPRCPY